MPTYTSFVDLTTREIQNAQELASVWGDIQSDLEEQGIDIHHSYAMLGPHDFVVTFEAADRDEAFTTAVALHRHGLDCETVPVLETADFAHIVDER